AERACLPASSRPRRRPYNRAGRASAPSPLGTDRPTCAAERALAHSVPPRRNALGDCLRRRELWLLLHAEIAETRALVQPPQRARRPPVVVAEQTHHG